MIIAELIDRKTKIALFMLHANTSEYHAQENLYGYQMVALLHMLKG